MACKADSAEVAVLKAHVVQQGAELTTLKSVQANQLAGLAKQVAELRMAQQKGKTAFAELH